MMKFTNRKLFLITLPFAIAILFYGRSIIWLNIDKIGAMATAAALFAAMYQSYVAWVAAKSTSESNAQNFFQQKFNLILEQHNNSLALVINWLKDNPFDEKKQTRMAVSYIRGHESLSPYMRILYHTLKNIKTEMPVTSRDDNDIIIIQKKYTSLVRSFIPNDVLYLIAINASVTKDKKLAIRDSFQYEKYYDMLMDYDFFEHLVIKNNNQLHLKEVMKDLSLKTYNACFEYYFDQAGYVCNKDVHIEKANDLIGDVNFFICLSYNLKNKYIVLPEYIKSKASVSALSVKIFKAYHKQLSVMGFLDFFSVKMDKSTGEEIKYFVENANYFHKYDFGSSNYGFFNATSLCEYISAGLKFSNTTQDLIKFRDGFHQAIDGLIRNTSIMFSDERLYLENIKYAKRNLNEKIETAASKIIKIKQTMDYAHDVKDVFDAKKEELELYVLDKIKT